MSQQWASPSDGRTNRFGNKARILISKPWAANSSTLHDDIFKQREKNVHRKDNDSRDKNGTKLR